MAVSIKSGRFTTGTSTGNIVVSGLGFSPVLVILYANGCTGTANTNFQNGTYVKSLGAFIAANKRCAVTANSLGGQSRGDTIKRMRSDACLEIFAGTGSGSGRLTVVSLDADGFTLSIASSFDSNYAVHYHAFGGTDLTHLEFGVITEPTAPGTYTETVGFRPSLVMFFSVGKDNEISTATVDSWLMFGAATRTQSALIAGGSNDNATPTVTRSHISTGGDCIAFPASNLTGIDARANVSAMTASGFNLNWSAQTAGGRRAFYIALQGGSWNIGTVTTSTGTGNIVTSGYGFPPRGGLLLSACKTAFDSPGSISSADELSVGMWTSASERQCMTGYDRDANGTTNTKRGMLDNAVYQNVVHNTLEGIMDIQSVDANGVTFVMDDTDPAANQAWFLATGDGSPMVFGSKRVVLPRRVAGLGDYRPPSGVRRPIRNQELYDWVS